MYQTAPVEKIADFTDLKAWQKAHELVLGVYQVTKSFPVQEQFGLTSQIRRSVISITSNIAVGFSRQTKADKIHFYHIALGSCSETQNQLIATRDLGFLPDKDFYRLFSLSVEVHKIINGLVKALRR